MEILHLTVVDLDLVQSSKSSIELNKHGGIEATNALYKEIERFVKQTLNPEKHHAIMDLGGDGYRISFKNIDHAYDFVINFSKFVDNTNKKYEQKGRIKRIFRISAVTGDIFYYKSDLLGDYVIRGDILRKLNRLLTGTDPGWFYIDQTTFNSLSVDKQKYFSKTTLIKGKSSEEGEFTAYCYLVKNLQTFKFSVVTVDGRGDKIHTKEYEAFSFVESLDKGIEIEMVQIPGGIFNMGSPENELKRSNSESPQHQVTVPTFFIGKYPITQAQWRCVAQLPRVNWELKAEPSGFKGYENLPVDSVSWYDAFEFCARLSNRTRREYRLPSEAEWEYACRAGTTTPFHFGETFTSKLANYKASYTYGDAPEGEYPDKTTPVGSFAVANAFGLYDMHGNVWEWCLDDWHDNYKGAPTDGSAWFDGNENNNLSRKSGIVVLRGGSWLSNPNICRSASRDYYGSRGYFDNVVGFRVVCAVGRT